MPVSFSRRFFFLFFFISPAATASAQLTLPDRIWADSLHAPFYHGVASGDPLTDRIILWTRITPLTPGPKTVYYELGTDSLLASPLLSGMIITDSLRDWTVKLDAAGLAPNTVYFYRFHDGASHYSVTGRTRTAPSGNTERVRLAVFSCSSIFSGYFNAYARIAEKSASLNAAVHLGDYVYDFVDPQEQVRVPSPYPTDPLTLGDWRQRQAYYLLDPDLRQARAQLPWIILWDNHDQNYSPEAGICDSGAIQAFYEWLPVRMPDSADFFRINRSFSFGTMADLFIADSYSRRYKHTWPGGEYNMFDTAQYHWLTDGLQNSTATWKLVGNERMAGGWYTGGIPQWLLDMAPNDGPVFDSASWDGFTQTRDSLFAFIADRDIDNFIILSGDAHVSVAQDLVSDPFNQAVYDPVTGLGSVGVEFLPTSISRGNLDESGAPVSLAATINGVDLSANPQHQFADLFQHGYGILDMTADSAVAEFWYSDILAFTPAETLGRTMVVLAGDNHWKRPGNTGLQENSAAPLLVYPNPSAGTFYLAASVPPGDAVIRDMLGRPVVQLSMDMPGSGYIYSFSLEHVPVGMYWLHTAAFRPVMLIRY